MHTESIATARSAPGKPALYPPEAAAGFRRAQRLGRIVLLALATCGAVAEFALAGGVACPCDCNRDSRVTGTEITTCVLILGGQRAPSACPAGDSDGNGRVTGTDITRGVQALGSASACGSAPTTSSASSLSSIVGLGITSIDFGRVARIGGGGASFDGSGSGGFFISAPCPDGGFVDAQCIAGPVSLLTLDFSACIFCDSPPSITSDGQVAFFSGTEALVFDGVFEELIENPNLCFEFDAAIPEGTLFIETLDGDFAFTSQLDGERFSLFAEDFVLAGVALANGGRQIAVSGTVGTCRGDVAFDTVSDLLIPDPTSCPTAGELRIALEDGTLARLRYTANGGVELDLNEDGIPEETLPTCEAFLEDDCPDEPDPIECSLPSDQCVACDFPGFACDFEVRRECRFCAFNCSGFQSRCAPSVVFAQCSDGIY